MRWVTVAILVGCGGTKGGDSGAPDPATPTGSTATSSGSSPTTGTVPPTPTGTSTGLGTGTGGTAPLCPPLTSTPVPCEPGTALDGTPSCAVGPPSWREPPVAERQVRYGR